MLLIDVDDHRWLDEKTRPELLAAAGNGRTAFPAFFDIAIHPRLLTRRDQRPHVDARVQAVAEFHGIGDAGDVRHHIVEMLALHIQARPCAAHLALIEENRAGGAGGGAWQVGIGHDDGWRLAAQFEGDPGHRVHGNLADLLAHGGGAGKGQLIHQRVVGQCGAGGDARAGDHIEHAFGITGFQYQLRQLQCGQWRFIGRLEHHGATGGQGRAELPAGQQQREVPGNDGTDHTHRFATDKAVELIVGHQRQRHLDAGAFDLGRPTGHVAQEVDGQLHVHHLCDGSAFAIVQALQLRQQLGVALHQVGEFPQQVLPLPGAGTAPGRVIERVTRGEHGAVDIFRRGPWHHTKHFASGRVVQGHGLAVGGLDPISADQHARCALDEGRSGGE